jgi:hypothetical protein
MAFMFNWTIGNWFDQLSMFSSMFDIQILIRDSKFKTVLICDSN